MNSDENNIEAIDEITEMRILSLKCKLALIETHAETFLEEFGKGTVGFYDCMKLIEMIVEECKIK